MKTAQKKDLTLALMIDAATENRVQAAVDRWREREPWANISRSSWARKIILEALDREENDAKCK